MAKKFGGTFSRRGPDAVTGELASILLAGESFEFKPLFTIVYTKLRARNLAGGGEEMFRLRVYEKLQELVRRGLVDRVVTQGVKEYSGLSALSTLLEPAPLIVAPNTVV